MENAWNLQVNLEVAAGLPIIFYNIGFFISHKIHRFCFIPWAMISCKLPEYLCFCQTLLASFIRSKLGWQLTQFFSLPSSGVGNGILKERPGLEQVGFALIYPIRPRMLVYILTLYRVLDIFSFFFLISKMKIMFKLINSNVIVSNFSIDF